MLQEGAVHADALHRVASMVMVMVASLVEFVGRFAIELRIRNMATAMVELVGTVDASIEIGSPVGVDASNEFMVAVDESQGRMGPRVVWSRRQICGRS